MFPPDVRATFSRRHLKLSSPQMPMPDNEMKAGILPGKVIIVENGKIRVPSSAAKLADEAADKRRPRCPQNHFQTAVAKAAA